MGIKSKITGSLLLTQFSQSQEGVILQKEKKQVNSVLWFFLIHVKCVWKMCELNGLLWSSLDDKQKWQ